MKTKDAMLLMFTAAMLWPRTGVGAPPPKGTTTTLFPPPPQKGIRSASFNGEWFPNDAQDVDGTGYYQDSNKQWWLIRRSGSLMDPSNQWDVAIIEPNNRYGRSPGWVTGTFSSAQDARDGADRFAIQARLQPSKKFPWLVLLVGYVALKGKR